MKVNDRDMLTKAMRRRRRSESLGANLEKEPEKIESREK